MKTQRREIFPSKISAASAPVKLGPSAGYARHCAMREAALLGMGVAMLAVPDVLPALESGSLIRLVRRWYADAGAISIYFGSRSLVPLKTKAFIEWIVAAFSKGRLPERFAGSIAG